MDRIKSITFDKKAQNNLPQHIKDKMKADRDNARKKTEIKGLNIPIVRESALKWFNSLGLEQRFYKTIECNHLITGDNTRHPSTLTGLEIEKIYKHMHSL